MTSKPSFTPCSDPPTGIHTVVVAALHQDEVLLQRDPEGALALPRFTFEAFESIESVVKTSMLMSLGALVGDTRLVGVLDKDLVYAARVVALDRPAPHEGMIGRALSLDQAAALLYAAYGKAADRILNEALTLQREHEDHLSFPGGSELP